MSYTLYKNSLILFLFIILPIHTLHASSLSVSKTNFQPNESIEVRFSDTPNNPKTWIGIYKRDQRSNYQYLDWLYTDGTKIGTWNKQHGTVKFTGLTRGNYEARLFFNNNYLLQANAPFIVTDSTSTTSSRLSTARVHHAGDRISIDFSHTSGNKLDWVGLFSKGASNNSYIDWLYTDGTKNGTKGIYNGTLTFSGLSTGDYETRLFSNNSYSLQASLPFSVRDKHNPVTVKMMTFNTWHGGSQVNDGRSKTLQAIRTSGADIISLQEAQNNIVSYLTSNLEWDHVYSFGDNAIISRHPITTQWTSDHGIGVKITLPNDVEIVVQNVHLSYILYGPYHACHDRDLAVDVLKKENASGRVNQITNNINDIQTYIDDGIPTFLMGDFNTPSHQDWIESTHPSHCGRVIPWSTTKVVTNAGMKDAFRAIHSNPLTHPGNTWSPVYNYNNPWGGGPFEPQDRIDLMFFSGEGVSVDNSAVFITGKPHPTPNHHYNEWPSDHAAVVSTFTIK